MWVGKHSGSRAQQHSLSRPTCARSTCGDGLVLAILGTALGLGSSNGTLSEVDAASTRSIRLWAGSAMSHVARNGTGIIRYGPGVFLMGICAAHLALSRTS